MLQPKRTKYRKQMKGRNRGLALRGNKVSFGEYGLKATPRGRLHPRQLDGARRAGAHFIAMQAGAVLYEMEGINEQEAGEAFKLAAAKLPVRTAFVTRTL